MLGLLKYSSTCKYVVWPARAYYTGPTTLQHSPQQYPPFSPSASPDLQHELPVAEHLRDPPARVRGATVPKGRRRRGRRRGTPVLVRATNTPYHTTHSTHTQHTHTAHTIRRTHHVEHSDYAGNILLFSSSQRTMVLLKVGYRRPKKTIKYNVSTYSSDIIDDAGVHARSAINLPTGA